MKIVVTGQVGLDKEAFIEQVIEIAASETVSIELFNVGRMMYAEAPDVVSGRILDLPLTRLHSLRRSVFKDILAGVGNGKSAHMIVNTHATFRWRHGLFYAFDYDQMKALGADLYICLVDNIDRVHWRLARDGHADHTLKDLMVWREEEILATELLSQIVRGHGCFYICAQGGDSTAAAAMARLILHHDRKKAYLSFPMSHVSPQSDVATVKEIEDFRREMKRYFTCFDPADVEEKHLCAAALQAAEQGHRTVSVGSGPARTVLDTAQLLDIIPDIDGQIYARDFKLIDQSDMIISIIPVVDDRPALSSGVERELQHAHEATKDVFVIWRSSAAPSPFITETATRVFRSTAEAVEFFHREDYVPTAPSGSLFS